MNIDRFKFRVWDEEYRRYHRDAERYRETGEFYPDIENCYCFGDFLKQPTRFVVEQCTGLKDKSGKLIFEGDVLGFYINVHPVYVQWDFSKCRFVLRRFDVEGWEISLIQDTAPRYSVIGNIHEMEVYNEK